MDGIRRSLETIEYYDQLPATWGIKIDVLGNVWVGRYQFPGVPTEEWEVFDTAGVWLGPIGISIGPPKVALGEWAVQGA